VTPPSLLPPPHPRPASPLYPDSDGQPIADNTLQYAWVALIKGNLDALFRDRDDVFVAADLLWYPVEGEPLIRVAPDALVAFGRPKGYRGSYKQWEEGGIAPQVVFEVLSPKNTQPEMIAKFHFYEEHGVEEYYVIDPEDHKAEGYTRGRAALRRVEALDGFVSPRLGVRFAVRPGQVQLFRPDGEVFRSFEDVDAGRQDALREAGEERHQKEEERRQKEQALHRAEEERRLKEEERRQKEEALRQAEGERREKEEAHRQAERLAEKLRALGIDPNA
jgi:Uma2 family endonuclease